MFQSWHVCTVSRNLRTSNGTLCAPAGVLPVGFNLTRCRLMKLSLAAARRGLSTKKHDGVGFLFALLSTKQQTVSRSTIVSTSRSPVCGMQLVAWLLEVEPMLTRAHPKLRTSNKECDGPSAPSALTFRSDHVRHLP